MNRRLSASRRRKRTSFRASTQEVLEARRLLTSTAVFNEIMYNPAGSEETLEWIELHNQMAVNLDLTGWSLQGGVSYSFPEGTTLAGKGYLVIAASPMDFAAAHDQLAALGPFTGNLNNAGEGIELRNNNQRLMDSLDYNDSGDWPAEADGSGASLAKVNEELASGPAENWSFSPWSGGTPGRANSSPPAPEIRTDTLLAAGDAVRVLIPTEPGDLDSQWTQPDFDDQAEPWFDATLGVGYDASGGSEVQTRIDAGGDLQSVMHNQNATALVRAPFQVDDPSAYEGLTLDLDYDDGFVAYLNGTEVARHQAPPGPPAWNAAATDEAKLAYDQRVLNTLDDGEQAPLGFWQLDEPAGTQKVINSGSAQQALRATFMDLNDTETGLNSSVPGLIEDSPAAADLDNFGHILGNGFETLPDGNPFEGDWTIEAWFQHDTVTENGTIFSNSVIPGGAVMGFIGSTNRFGVSSGGLSGLNVSVDLGAAHFDQPIYAAITKTGGNQAGQATFRVYVNVNGTWQTVGQGTNAWTLNPQDGFMIGRNFGIGYQLFDGVIDQVAVYNRALDPTAVESHYLWSGRTAENSLGIPPNTDSLARQSIDLTDHLDLLVAGENVLAIHGLNLSADDEDFLVHPQLVAQYVTPPVPSPVNVAINEVSAATDTQFFVELINLEDQPVDLTNFVLKSGNAGNVYTFPSTTLAAGGLHLLSAEELRFLPANGQKLHLLGPQQSVVLDAVEVTNRLRGRAESLEGRWLFPSTPTPGTPNVFLLQEDVVINEIMYHYQPQPPTPDVPGQTQTGQLVPFSATWRYSDAGIDQGLDWASNEHAVDDVAWFSGRGMFGFDTTPANLPASIRTPFADPQTNDPPIPTYYFERDFNLALIREEGFQLLFQHILDDGAVIYINGIEAGRINMPGGTVNYDTLASGFRGGRRAAGAHSPGHPCPGPRCQSDFGRGASSHSHQQ